MTLNAQQQQAVNATDGRVLVLAGAGSGKTKVIVHRIAHLIKKGADPSSILGLTFTNKAAAEMRERIGKLLSPKEAKQVVLCTFHSFCMRLLRKEIQHLGYTQNFSLYDERDIRRLLKQMTREVLEHEGDLPSIEPVYQEIARAKSVGDTPKDKISQTLFQRLQTSMRAFNAVDFDSLLTLTLELFEKHPEVLEKYQDHFRYIMIDEYQDTNPIQYKIAKSLSAKYNNLCVVGDDDQSIYGWRGAEIKNILTFESTHFIKLEQNYRSLPNILKAANSLIANNSERHDKQLYSNVSDSEQITIFHAPHEENEASAVVQRMLHLRQTRNLRWRDFAILYRSNALSRPFEMALMQGMWQKNGEYKRGIPYQVFGGTELYERSEVKDLMAYLRAIANPRDEEALLRIINVPRRGISDKTLAILTQENRAAKIPLWQVLNELKSHPELKERAIQAVQNFVYLIHNAQDTFKTKPLKDAFEELVELIDYKKAIEEEVKSEKMRTFKWENVQASIEALRLYEEQTHEPSLQDFLTTTLLDQNKFSKKEKDLIADKVNVMTFHSAKGLEFEAVFLVALEDHIIPHEKSFQLEEERRLMYVAITRAKKYLNLSMARQRKRYGKEEKSSPSRFLFEIPKDLLRTISWRTPFL
ncbi:MAG: UvrD-helicase domain-containing protein [Simkaniaceae bacterium]|nr:UvrD-helicase domain-containing protein [Candidatus Sacchlamyda saccharinae]